jgi:hypothetical protein
VVDGVLATVGGRLDVEVIADLARFHPHPVDYDGACSTT